MSDARARQERHKQRSEEATQRLSERNNSNSELRQVAATELVADTLIDIRDLLSDLRDTLDQINVKRG